MIKAALRSRTGGGPVLLIGLSAENMARLGIDKPIAFNAADVGFAPLPIVIIGGVTEDDIQDQVTRVGGYLAQVAMTDPAVDQPPPAPPTEADYAAAAAALDSLPPGAATGGDLARVALNAAYAARVNVAAAGESFTCPRCLVVSHNPNDATHGYCARCHAFTGVDIHVGR
jgi:hypothetical protein